MLEPNIWCLVQWRWHSEDGDIQEGTAVLPNFINMASMPRTLPRRQQRGPSSVSSAASQHFATGAYWVAPALMQCHIQVIQGKQHATASAHNALWRTLHMRPWHCCPACCYMFARESLADFPAAVHVLCQALILTMQRLQQQYPRQPGSVPSRPSRSTLGPSQHWSHDTMALTLVACAACLQAPLAQVVARLQGLLNLAQLTQQAFLVFLLSIAFAEPRDFEGQRLEQDASGACLALRPALRLLDLALRQQLQVQEDLAGVQHGFFLGPKAGSAPGRLETSAGGVSSYKVGIQRAASTGPVATRRILGFDRAQIEDE